jgi:hypothetical protein
MTEKTGKKVDNKSFSEGVLEGMSEGISAGSSESRERIFGHRVRKLIKLVAEAFLNPGKCPISILFNPNFICFSTYSMGCRRLLPR